MSFVVADVDVAAAAFVSFAESVVAPVLIVFQFLHNFFSLMLTD